MIQCLAVGEIEGGREREGESGSLSLSLSLSVRARARGCFSLLHILNKNVAHRNPSMGETNEEGYKVPVFAK